MADFTNFNDTDYLKDFEFKANIKVVGVGGGGGNAINRMIQNEVDGVQYIAINTDSQDLLKSHATSRILIGKKTTKGLGAGQKREVGEACALENEKDIRKVLEGADLVFVTCGMGGGTGTGASPVVAKIAKELGSLVVAIVTFPFMVEGRIRKENAIYGIENIKPYCDILIVIQNDNISKTFSEDIPIVKAYREVDNILRQAVQGIVEIISTTAIVNVDFNDLKTTIENKGTALMGIGIAEGENRAVNAVRRAMTSKLLGKDVKGATDGIVHITASSSISIKEQNIILEEIRNKTTKNVNIIHGFAINEQLKDEIIVTAILTGMEQNQEEDKTNDFADEISNLDFEQDYYESDSKDTVDKIKQFLNRNENEKSILNFSNQEVKKEKNFENDNIENNDEDKNKKERKKNKLPSWLIRK